MKLLEVSLAESPDGPDRVRLEGTYLFGEGLAQRERLWFEVPTPLAESLSTSGNPWLACLLPMAVTLREPLELCLPVDGALHEGAIALMQTWSGAYPQGRYRPIDLVTEILPAQRSPASKTVQFFTGGVDSFFTLLRHAPDGDAIDRRVIDELLTVWGLDIPLADAGAFGRLAGSIEALARPLGMSTAVLATNLRESAWQLTHWGEIGQGPALAGLALALEGRYRHAVLPASVSYGVFLPYGTHPLFDPLLSTANLRFEDDGGQWTRMEKLTRVVRSDLAMNRLRVCWEGRSELNCGRCEKCLRTLAMLEILGARHRAVTFPAEAWSLEALANLRLRNSTASWSMSELARVAAEAGRHNVAAAARRSVRHSRRRRAIGRLLRAIRRRP
jgi:hypothetical protein